MPDRLAAVEGPGQVELRGERPQARQRIAVQGESLSVGVELADAPQPQAGTAAQLGRGPGVGGLDDAAAHHPVGMTPLQLGGEVVGLGAEARVAERPREDHGAVDALAIEVSEQIRLTGEPCVAGVADGEPGVGRRHPRGLAADPIRHDVDVGVDDGAAHEKPRTS